MVSCAERDGQRLIAVTLNDPNDWADHAALFDYGFAHYRSAMLALANRTFRMLPVTGSLNRFVPVYTASDVYYPLTEGELVKARVELPERVEAPIQGGTIAGRLLFTLDGAVIGETYLLYAGDVADDQAGRGLFGRVLDWFRAGRPTRWRRSAAAGSLIRICKRGSGHGRAAAENPFGPRRVLPAGGGGLSLRRAGDGKRMYRAGGDKADPERDDIRVDGRPLRRPARRTYLMLNKPRGYVTTLSDEKGRRTVAELVAGCGARVWPVGRLDLDSEGLLLLTDDGALTHALLHPSHEVEKEYQVWVEGDVDTALPVLRGPMELDGYALRPAQVTPVGEGCSPWSSMRGATGRCAGCAPQRACRCAASSGCGRGALPGRAACGSMAAPDR